MTSDEPRRDLFSLVERHPKLTLVMAVLAGLAATAIFQSLPREARKLALTPVVQAVLEDPGSPRAGAANPDVTIVVFTDYQCSVCKATAPALQQLLADDKKVQVIFKDWPILGEASTIAAHAALDFSMFMLRDHAALPVFIAAWAAAGLLCLVLARRLYGSLRRPAPEPAPATPVAA